MEGKLGAGMRIAREEGGEREKGGLWFCEHEPRVVCSLVRFRSDLGHEDGPLTFVDLANHSPLRLGRLSGERGSLFVLSYLSHPTVNIFTRGISDFRQQTKSASVCGHDTGRTQIRTVCMCRYR